MGTFSKIIFASPFLILGAVGMAAGLDVMPDGELSIFPGEPTDFTYGGEKDLELLKTQALVEFGAASALLYMGGKWVVS